MLKNVICAFFFLFSSLFILGSDKDFQTYVKKISAHFLEVAFNEKLQILCNVLKSPVL